MRDKKLTKWGKSWKSLKKPWGLRLEWDESVWERKRESYRKRDRRKWAADCTRRLYRPLVNLNRCRYWDSYRGRYWGNGCRQIQVSRRCRGTIHQMQEQKLDLSTSCREAIEEAGAFSIYPPGIEKLSRLRYEEKLKELDRQLTIEKVSRRWRASFSKQFFEKWKTQIWIQSNMQLNQWSNQHIKLSKTSFNNNF